MGGRGGGIRKGGKKGGEGPWAEGGRLSSRGGLSPSFKGGWKVLDDGTQSRAPKSTFDVICCITCPMVSD